MHIYHKIRMIDFTFNRKDFQSLIDLVKKEEDLLYFLELDPICMVDLGNYVMCLSFVQTINSIVTS
jgi:hypothetical protein